MGWHERMKEKYLLKLKENKLPHHITAEVIEEYWDQQKARAKDNEERERLRAEREDKLAERTKERKEILETSQPKINKLRAAKDGNNLAVFVYWETANEPHKKIDSYSLYYRETLTDTWSQWGAQMQKPQNWGELVRGLDMKKTYDFAVVAESKHMSVFSDVEAVSAKDIE